MEAIEAALELELIADEIGGESEPLEVVAAQLGRMVCATEPVEGLAPRAAGVIRSGLLEVSRHRRPMYCGLSRSSPVPPSGRPGVGWMTGGEIQWSGSEGAVQD